MALQGFDWFFIWLSTINLNMHSEKSFCMGLANSNAIITYWKPYVVRMSLTVRSGPVKKNTAKKKKNYFSFEKYQIINF